MFIKLANEVTFSVDMFNFSSIFNIARVAENERLDLVATVSTNLNYKLGLLNVLCRFHFHIGAPKVWFSIFFVRGRKWKFASVARDDRRQGLLRYFLLSNLPCAIALYK